MNHYGLYKTIGIKFSVIANNDLLNLLTNPAFKYSSCTYENYNLKYYKNGFTLMKTSDFIEKYAKITPSRPASDYVVLFSMNSSVVPNGTTILKTRNRVSLVAPVELRLVQDGERSYTNVGVSLDPSNIEFSQALINVYTGDGTMIGRTAEMRAYVENVSDFVQELEKEVIPIFDRIGSVIRHSARASWSDPKNHPTLLSFIERALTKTGIYLAEAEDARKQLAEALMGGIAVKQVEIDDVTWDSKEDMEYALREVNGDIMKAKEIRRGELRLKHLLDDCTFEQRLKELTREEVENRADMLRPNITLAMKEPEIDIYYRLTDKEDIAELELKVINRWREAQK